MNNQEHKTASMDIATSMLNESLLCARTTVTAKRLAQAIHTAKRNTTRWSASFFWARLRVSSLEVSPIMSMTIAKKQRICAFQADKKRKDKEKSGSIKNTKTPVPKDRIARGRGSKNFSELVDSLEDILSIPSESSELKVLRIDTNSWRFNNPCIAGYRVASFLTVEILWLVHTLIYLTTAITPGFVSFLGKAFA